jgi:DUF2933 family protein
VQPRRNFLVSRSGFVLLGFLAVAIALLFTEHRAHVLGAFVYLPVLLCFVMHMFMHGKHGHENHERQDRHGSGP